ncbi:hypothetical protein [Cellulophaga baltica]|uniref:hypothetical protein n=1 Tax=Cellulophaga baltica TaxID=76594 RepID=UPI002495844C|nr:hypothetical protein [Cellulophaga baltica]
MYTIIKKLLTIIISLSFVSCFGQSENEYAIETSDITNFWIAFDSIKNTEDKAKVFKELYHNKASKLFKEQLDISPDMQDIRTYLQSFEQYPKFWESLRKPTMDMHGISKNIQACYDKVENIYPKFKPGNVCVFLTPMVFQGRVHEGKTILMAAEMNAPLSEIDLSEFEEDMSFIYVNNIQSTIIHETIHLQQKYEAKNVLSACIKEGSADFLAELFYGQPFKSPAYDYGRKNESKLWTEFSKELSSEDWSKWLYGASETDKRPMDTGYFMDYMITKSYYEKAKDKNQAIKQIIEITDFNQFLKDSGYITKLKK